MASGWLLFAPLISALACLVWLRRKHDLAMFLSVGTCAISFAIAVALFVGAIPVPQPWNWISVTGSAANLVVPIGWYVDNTTRMMLLVVTGVGLLVHLFSIGYMAHDEGRGRFFGELSLFMFSMLGIVVANNFVMMFIFWELVGVSSYLLIGFWFHKPAAAEAANKAFLCNRVGDFGFLMGILMYWSITGTVMFQLSTASASTLATQTPTVLTTLGVLLFCGCVGKSAMVPLHVWLPDAMEGPTPVSALIHAATMVAAGVYMLVRIFHPVLEASLDARLVIATVGGFTALFAALIATQQNDIKRILAYSTLSQLGYMVMAVGIAAPGAAMFHLTTHAFFKALLFLAAGSVIHALHEEQDIWNMGGLWKKIPITFATFTLGTLALTGFPGFAGFFSKDEIILAAYEKFPCLYAIGLITAALTAFYMFRLVFVAFFGPARTEKAEHPHESPAVMTAPLILLAILSVIGGWSILGIHSYIVGGHAAAGHQPGHGLTLGLSILAFAVGSLSAYFLYFNKKADPIKISLFANKFYIDEIYLNGPIKFQQAIARILAWVDNWIVGGCLVRGTAFVSNLTGEALRLFQTGSLQAYAFLFSFGTVLILYFTLFR